MTVRHPFTLPTVALGVLALVVLLPAPSGPLALALSAVVAATVIGPARIAVRAALLCLMPALFLLVLHAGLGDARTASLAGVRYAPEGFMTALAQTARLYAVLGWSLLTIARLQPSRFLDAAAASGRGVSGALAVVAALQAIPRLGARAARITEAQRTRGLAAGGSPLRRLRALAPLALPLVLGAIVEADDRAAMLELRGMAAGVPRTPLELPPPALAERVVRWMVLGLVLAALAWRVTR